ncbi:MAG: exodeoxyribonuclease VII small subunit [Synechococcaceae cyanobacterium]|nr:exodeoxyribonuclease VII small subunit [Synechococcaceae cyanobacterium]
MPDSTPRRTGGRSSRAGRDAPPPAAAPAAIEGLDDLSFREAQLALELVLSQLQASDLDVEAMVSLHRRGQAYADRCQQLLLQVEQEVQQWDPDQPDAPAQPYSA